MKAPKVKAVLRKANNCLPDGSHDDRFDSFILPADAESYERMVE